MDKKSNMKQAMYEMFGVGSDQTEKAEPAEPRAKQQAVSEKTGADKKGANVMAERTVETPSVKASAPIAKPKAGASYFAPGTVFEGTLRSAGDIEIAGDFKGNITTDGAVILHSGMQGNITASSLKLASCSLNGDVVATDVVSVGEHSKIVGNVTAKELKCAGQINGDLTVSESVVLERSAQVIGNIITGSIAVEKGAILKGGIEIKTK